MLMALLSNANLFIASLVARAQLVVNSAEPPLPLPTLTTTRNKTGKTHRHSHKLKHALELLVRLSDQAVTPAEREDGEHVEREEVSLYNKSELQEMDETDLLNL